MLLAKNLIRLMIATYSLTGFASILPPNNLHLQDRLVGGGGLTEKQFNDTIDYVSAYYAPVIEHFKGKLNVDRNWDDPTVNAYANRVGDTWNIAMFGGLARRPEVTEDGFAMVVCHELGHHLGGFPFVREWAADEGQSDYFATQACARNLWKTDFAVNASFAKKVDKTAKEKCDNSWDSKSEQKLCYRIASASFSLATLLGALNNQVPSFSTPDTSKVTTTDHAHPKAQCRLDTYLAGALCKKEFKDDLIPGVSSTLNDAAKEKQALSVSCSQFSKKDEFAGRRACWFKETPKTVKK
jgi:hypothetical protein